ncbi:MAG TPA: DUF4435 domain-containing protein [Nitrospira sp.]|nr:DUF4435 domain-containing protein [Burkholderiaceae bacterium]HNB43142.1 DUF4435 domain-containing protein [Burkholderiaceae bacterium]HNC84868.1 DUF4435 domain-containing protein [Nitrospira sp.]HND85454.1 DUF4435 domain-containing protein [Pseudobdellovibrionaceae bacterium]HNG78147.1 DUF4435 domain-containing protein [Burkholderiaceae bacterium]
MSNLQPTPSEVVTEIVMSRDRRPWLAVEGDSDERLLRTRTYPVHPKIVIGYGWEGVRDIILEFHKEESRSIVIGLIDRDYRDHFDEQIQHSKIILSDFRDIENMLFNSSALARVVSEYGSDNKVPKTPQGEIDSNSVRDKIYATSVKLGKLRIFCQSKFPKLSFKKIEHKKFVCDKTLALNPNTLLAHLSGKNPGQPIPTNAQWEEAQLMTWPSEHLNSPQFVANGHDVMAILCIALRRIWGTNGGDLDIESIEGSFRIGYSDDELVKSDMWAKIVNNLNSTPRASDG